MITFQVAIIYYTLLNYVTYHFVDAANCSVRITSEQYRSDDVQLSVKLFQHKHMTFNPSILPRVPMNFNGSTMSSFQVTLLYNVKYNLSVECKFLCRDNMITHMELHYGELFAIPDIDNKPN